MSEFALTPEMLQQLEEVAQDNSRSVTDVLNEIVRDYLARRHDEKISLESARFQDMHSELRDRFAGQHIAMRDGQVLDHDVNLAALHQRILAHYGRAPILIAPVTAEPVQEFRIRRPRLERLGL